MKHHRSKVLLFLLSMGLLGFSCTKKDVDVDLTARDWKVEKIRKSGKLIYTTTDSTYILHFSSEEAYNLTLDVNTCVGLYEIKPKGTIAFQAMACTKICCDTEFASDLTALFPGMTGFFVRDNKLYFEGEGEIILQPL